MTDEKFLPEREHSELSTDKKIDRDNLDLESQNLPTVYSKWAFRQVRAEHEFKQAKDAFEMTIAQLKLQADKSNASLELVRADLSKKIRSTPAFYNIEKVTEASVEAAIITQDDYKTTQEKMLMDRAYQNNSTYQNAQTKLREAEYAYNLLEAARDTIVTKRTSIKTMSDLWTAGYWSSNEGPDGIDRVRSDQREGLKK